MIRNAAVGWLGIAFVVVGATLFFPGMLWWLQNMHEVGVRRSGLWHEPLIAAAVLSCLGLWLSRHLMPVLGVTWRSVLAILALATAVISASVIARLQEALLFSRCAAQTDRAVWACEAALSIGRRYQVPHARNQILSQLSRYCRTAVGGHYSCWVIFGECQSRACREMACPGLQAECARSGTQTLPCVQVAEDCARADTL